MFLSIVTITYNNLSGLHKTFDSLSSWLSERDNNHWFEWIVIDGGSKDGSVEFLNRHNHLIDYWVSEPDKGVYNAMNKGIKASKGDYLWFLNAGDCKIESLSAEDLQGCLREGSKIIYGDIFEEDCNGNRHLLKQTDSLSVDHFIGGHLSHQSMFISRELFSTTLYDESFRIAADHDFVIKKLFLEHCTYKHVPIVVAVYESFGMSAQQYYSITRPELRRAVSQALDGGEYWYDSILMRRELDDEVLFNHMQYLTSAKKLRHVICKLLSLIITCYQWCKNAERKIRNR